MILIINLILVVVATLLFMVLMPINLILVIFKYGFFFASNYFFQTAYNIDVFGNREYRTLFNITLIKSNGYKFGKNGETISSVLGKNKRDKTLSILGVILSFILNSLDKNHVEKSIMD